MFNRVWVSFPFSLFAIAIIQICSMAIPADAAKILFIGETEEPAEGDPGALDRLNALGHAVTYRQGITTTGSDVDGFDLLVLSATNLTANVRFNGFESIPQPILTWESSMVRNVEGEFWLTSSQTSGNLGAAVTVVDASHPILAGIDVQDGQALEIFVDDQQNFFGLNGDVASGATIVAVGADPCCGEDRYQIVEIAKGGKVLEGSGFPNDESPGARVFIPLSNTSFDFLNETGLKIFDNAVTFALGKGPALPGDFDGDGLLDANDIDALTAEVVAGTNSRQFDLGNDGKVDQADRRTWIKDLRRTWYGDANLDGEFNSADFVRVFQIGEYEDTTANNSTWAEGDWNGDKEFNSSDFIAAFQDGGFEKGPVAANVVPEPSTFVMAMSALPLIRRRRRR